MGRKVSHELQGSVTEERRGRRAMKLGEETEGSPSNECMDAKYSSPKKNPLEVNMKNVNNSCNIWVVDTWMLAKSFFVLLFFKYFTLKEEYLSAEAQMQRKVSVTIQFTTLEI